MGRFSRALWGICGPVRLLVGRGFAVIQFDFVGTGNFFARRSVRGVKGVNQEIPMKTENTPPAILDELKSDLRKYSQRIQKEVLPVLAEKAAVGCRQSRERFQNDVVPCLSQVRSRMARFSHSAFNQLQDQRKRLVAIPVNRKALRRNLAFALSGMLVCGTVGLAVKISLSNQGEVAVSQLNETRTSIVGEKAIAVGDEVAEEAVNTPMIELAEVVVEESAAEHPVTESSDDFFVSLANSEGLALLQGLQSRSSEESAYLQQQAYRQQQQAYEYQQEASRTASESAQREMQRYRQQMAGRMGARGVTGY